MDPDGSGRVVGAAGRPVGAAQRICARIADKDFREANDGE